MAAPDSTASVSDRLRVDADRDGVQDSGESAVPGVAVALYSGQDSFLASVVTGAAGLDGFAGLDPGVYLLVAIAPADVFSPHGVGNDNVDSDVDPTGGVTPFFELDAGEVASDRDAGSTAAEAQIGDRIWLDGEADGIQDGGEPGDSGRGAARYHGPEGPPFSSRSFEATASTDEDGFYAFGVEPGRSCVALLASIPAGIRLVITESGFAALPDDARRLEALRGNEQGWSEQIQNIRAHVESRDPCASRGSGAGVRRPRRRHPSRAGGAPE